MLCLGLSAVTPGCNSHPDLGPRVTDIPAGGSPLPTRLVDGLWIVRAQLPNLDRKQTLLLDTGTDRTLLDLQLARRIGLGMSGETNVRSATGRVLPSTSLDRLPWLVAGKATFRDIEVAGIDLQPLRRASGLPIQGILGCDLFRQCLLELDYRRRQARVLPPAEAPDQEAHHFSTRLPWVTITAANQEIRALVDTGFQDALAVPPTTSLPWQTAPRPDGELATLQGPSDKEVGRLAGNIECGEIVRRNPLVVVSPGSPKIGTAILRRCRWLLDTGGGRLWMQPYRRR
ncbi:MAG: pepsin/retropepsin-like aspartic protease family protein [Planctomycetota bacterium]|nr:pepsin/retropepsin-like aspartic protease family protein [Planctomycetota bacterium]